MDLSNSKTATLLLITGFVLVIFSVITYNANSSYFPSSGSNTNQQQALKDIRTSAGLGIAMCCLVIVALLYMLWSKNKTRVPLLEGAP